MRIAQWQRAGRLRAISCLVLMLIVAPSNIRLDLIHGDLSLEMTIAAARDGSSGSDSGGSGSTSGDGSNSGSNSGSSGGSDDSGRSSGSSGSSHSGGDDGNDSGARKGSDDRSGRGHYIGVGGENIEVRGNRIQVIYPNGWKEELKGGLFEMRDPAGRIVTRRPATAKDRARMKSLWR